jgi:hypothetical protein
VGDHSGEYEFISTSNLLLVDKTLIKTDLAELFPLFEV